MKIAILKRSDLSVQTIYEASAPNQAAYGGPWGDDRQTIHVAIPNSIEARAAEFEWLDENNVNVTENAELKAQIQQEDALNAATTAIGNAIKFGQSLITKFAAQNVLLGITQDGKTGEVLNKMSGVIVALQSGSLYEAIERAKAINPEDYDAKYITHDRIYAFINELEAYLGLPLSL